MQNDFQRRFLKAIESKRMTAADLNRITGIDKGSISNYMSGKYIPKQDKCFLLARALDVDPGWLMTGDEQIHMDLSLTEENDCNNETFTLVSAWKKAEDWQKKAVRKLLNMNEVTP